MRRLFFPAVLLLFIAGLTVLLSPAVQAEIGTFQEPPYEETYEPPYVPPGEETPVPAQQNSGGGPNDGRLNWTPDEYYTLYCAFDMLEVWRGVPEGLMLATIPLTSLLALNVGQTFMGGGVAVERSSDDVYTVAGTNGNLAPVYGSKTFSMSECIDRNGGAPAAPPQPPQPPQQQSNETDPFTQFCETSPSSRICFDSEAQWCAATNYADVDCVPYSFSRLLGWLVELAFACWLGIPVGMVFFSTGAFARWYARRK